MFLFEIQVLRSKVQYMKSSFTYSFTHLASSTTEINRFWTFAHILFTKHGSGLRGMLNCSTKLLSLQGFWFTIPKRPSETKVDALPALALASHALGCHGKMPLFEISSFFSATHCDSWQFCDIWQSCVHLFPFDKNIYSHVERTFWNDNLYS